MADKDTPKLELIHGERPEFMPREKSTAELTVIDADGEEHTPDVVAKMVAEEALLRYFEKTPTEEIPSAGEPTVEVPIITHEDVPLVQRRPPELRAAERIITSEDVPKK